MWAVKSCLFQILKVGRLCLPLVFGDDGRRFLQPMLRSDSMWGETRNTRTSQEKCKSSEGEAKRKGSFVSDLRRGRCNQVKTQRMWKTCIFFSESGEAWREEDPHKASIHWSFETCDFLYMWEGQAAWGEGDTENTVWCWNFPSLSLPFLWIY